MTAVDGLQAWDEATFRWINRDATGAWLDPVARFLSGNPLFIPMLVLVAAALLWRGGVRGWVFVITLGIAVGLANEFVAEPLKDWVRRPRPFVALSDAILRVGKGNPLGSMPSAHAMNMAVIATVTVWFYRRLGLGVALIALGVGWSRVYNGVHFPGDVLAGFLLGSMVAVAAVLAADQVWRKWVLRWRPEWGRSLPTLGWRGSIGRAASQAKGDSE